MSWSQNIVLVLLFSLFFHTSGLSQKINGVCFVSPGKESSFSNFNSFNRISAKWVALTPYAFSRAKEPFVKFNSEHSWWGEQSAGTVAMIKQAKADSLKIMLKPHVWVMGEGWCGQFDLKTDEEWAEWEKDYARYIITYAKIAEKHKVEMLCIGTEYKIAATKREVFWRGLIKAIRKIYNGKVTYAANWDNYANIKFWDDLDFVGVDAYFPLSQSKTANIKELNQKWQIIVNELQTFSKKQNKKVLFTEFGYKSIHFSAWNQWELESIREDVNVNLQAQVNTYSSLFENIWGESWFGGGFLWKWFANDDNSGGLNNSDYTPQNKPVEQIIQKYYQIEED